MYSEQSFNLPELKGLSTKQIEVHLKLYAGYVKNTNALMAKIDEYKKASESNAIALSELKRRFGFEFNGMRLHELYFEALGGDGNPGEGSLISAIEKQWGSFDAWLNEFKAVGMMRGIGWTLLVHDPKAGMLHNVWVSDHEVGHLGGLPIILAMDVWEHAFMVDYVPAERPNYINVFFENLRWDIISSRYAK